MATFIVADPEVTAVLSADGIGRSGQDSLVAAATGQAVLEEAARQRPDLVIFPASLPDMPTEQCAHRLRAMLGASRRLVTAVTVRGPSAEPRRRTTARDDLIEVPVAREALYGLIKQVVPGRRSSIRVGLELDLALPDGSTARVRDISRGGVQLEVGAPLAAGARLRMRLELPRFQNPLALTGVVVWSRRESAGRAAAGLRFTEVGGFEQRVLDAFVMTAPTPVQL